MVNCALSRLNPIASFFAYEAAQIAQGENPAKEGKAMFSSGGIEFFTKQRLKK